MTVFLVTSNSEGDKGIESEVSNKHVRMCAFIEGDHQS